MIDAIITYLPFYRVHELKDVFVDNWIQLGSKRAIAYVDNVYNDSQKALLTKILSPDLEELEIRTGNWGDRNETFLTIIKDCISEGIESIVVDSDNNLSSSFGRIDAALCEAGFSFYTVMEEDNPDLTKYLARSKLLGQVSVNGQRSISVYGYRVKGTWNGIFYIGRKQAVKLDATLLKRLDRTVINDVEKSLLRIPAQLRNYMSDEITLGFIYYYSGISRVPWIISSHHRHHGSTPSIDKDFRRLLSSTAICGFARRLPKRKYPRATWLYLRYKVAQLYYATTWFIKN
jgi:hypothetical protein